MRVLILVAVLGAGVLVQRSEVPATAYRTILEFDIMSKQDTFSRTIGDGLTLRAGIERTYPLELRLECERCRVTDEAVQSPPAIVYRNEFTAGTVRIALRRLASPNPSQIR